MPNVANTIKPNTAPVTDTRRSLAEITDQGLFERLACSTLRIADPLYSGIVETGTNARGQTIPDPVDGIVYALDESGQRYGIVAHHTITARAQLRDKWLNPQEGDIAKGAASLAKTMTKTPGLKGRLILTSSHDPNSTLVTDVESAATEHGIEIDLWPGSRLSHLLDVSPDGQWVRAKTLGFPQQRLSRALAIDIGARMIEAARPFAEPAEFIKRKMRKTLDDRMTASPGLLFVTGRSGVGKSVLCYDLANNVQRLGGVAFVLSETVIAEASTLEEALRNSIKAYAPAVCEQNIVDALAKLFTRAEIVVWIEDIHRSNAPVDLVQKLLQWTREPLTANSGEQKTSALNIFPHLICPVWPEVISGLPKDVKDAVDAHSIILDEYNWSEGGQAVYARAQRAGATITLLEAQNIAEALSHDPLLIGLVSDWRAPNAADVIDEYLQRESRKAAANADLQPSEIASALYSLAAAMIANGSISPAWRDAICWLPSETEKVALRALAKTRSILSVDKQDIIRFRHDRVRDRLLTQSLAVDLKSGDISVDVLSDPFLARIVGEAVLSIWPSPSVLLEIELHAPLALFHCYAAAVRRHHDAEADLFKACHRYLGSMAFNNCPPSKRFAIHVVLAELDGEGALALLRQSPEICFAKQEGLARNGDVRAAAKFCYHHGPYTTSPRRDRLLAHGIARHGGTWIADIAALLTDKNVGSELLAGAFNLAGELGHPALNNALKKRWSLMARDSSTLEEGMLFAAITCGAGRDNEFVDEVVQVWAALPDKVPGDRNKSPRYEVAEYSLGGGLRRHETDRVVSYVVKIAERHTSLKRVVAWVLRYVDHPDAVRLVARSVADTDRRCDENGSFHPWGMSFADHWGARRERHSRKLSASSRAALKMDWSDNEHDLWYRKRCFDLWSATLDPQDIVDLAQNSPTDLEDRALATRLRHGDQSAIPELAGRIDPGKPDCYWWQFYRYVGSIGLEQKIEETLETRRLFQREQADKFFQPDNILPELLADRDDAFAFEMLEKHWDHLAEKRQYVFSLLYLATPQSLALVESTLQSREDLQEVFQHIDMRIGIKTANRPGLKRIAQLDALTRYLEHLSDSTLRSLWDACNERGWYDSRRKHLDPLVEFPLDRTFARVSEDKDFEWLDHQMTQDHRVRRNSHYWAKDRLVAGITHADIVDRAARYANSRKTADAYFFFADVVGEHGVRNDIDRLRPDWIRDSATCNAEAENAEHAVRLRRIN